VGAGAGHGLAEPAHHSVRHRIAPFGPVDRDPGHAAGDLEQHFLAHRTNRLVIPGEYASARYRGRAMLVLGIAVAAALLIPLVTHGSYKRLFETKLHWTGLLVDRLAIQLGLDFYD